MSMGQFKFTAGLLSLWALGSVMANEEGGLYFCLPSTTSWKTGDTVKIQFMLYSFKFPSMCERGTNGLVNFESSTDGSFYRRQCGTGDIRQNGACSFTSGRLGCGCTRKYYGFYFLEYNFVFTANGHRFWRTNVACVDRDGGSALYFKGEGCVYLPDWQEVSVRLICPEPSVRIGEVNPLTCLVNMTALKQEGCQHVGQYVIFQLVHNIHSRNRYPLCVTSVHDCDNEQQPEGCKCTTQDGKELRRFEMDFYGDAIMPHSSFLDCDVPCLPRIKPSRQRSSACQQMSFPGIQSQRATASNSDRIRFTNALKIIMYINNVALMLSQLTVTEIWE